LRKASKESNKAKLVQSDAKQFYEMLNEMSNYIEYVSYINSKYFTVSV